MHASSSSSALPRLSASSSPQRRSLSNTASSTDGAVSVPSTTVSGSARFLGRMSWDRDLLDATSSAELQSSLRCSLSSSSLQSVSTTKSLQQQPTLHALARSETSLQPRHKYSVRATSTRSLVPTASGAMSYDESMREVEQLLTDNVRHRYYDRREKSAQEIATLRTAEVRAEPHKQRAVSRALAAASVRRFDFVPLQDPVVLAAVRAQDDDDDDNGDNDDNDDGDADDDDAGDPDSESRDANDPEADDTVARRASTRSNREKRANKRNADISTQERSPDTRIPSPVRLKYFGAAAKSAYYKTYQELHGKSHLFVERPSAYAGTKSVPAPALSLRTSSSASSPSLLQSPVSPMQRMPAVLSSIAVLPLGRDVTSTNSSTDETEPMPTDAQALDPAEAATSDVAQAPLPLSSIVRRRQALQSSVLTATFAQSLSSSSLASSPSLHSPRVLFLSACIAESHPALSLLLRKDSCRAYDFRHQGLGDAFIERFAVCLPDLPLVEAINVRDNRLSDRALNRLLQALEHKPQLTHLDISENEVGRASAESLRQYVASTLCTVTTLVVNSADVDDDECTRFMTAFEQNKSVAHLALASNRIGQRVSTRRTKAVAKPNEATNTMTSTSTNTVVTGGEAIGAMLNVNLTIVTLDLSWNLLTAVSAAPIGRALQLNYNLRELTLAYNACGDHGAMVFGQTIRINTALTKLDLRYNSIGAKGALVLASGLTANRGLRELVLDGNAIGLESGRALVHASCTRVSGSVCHVSLFECSLTQTTTPSVSGQQTSGSDSRSRKAMTLFNPADPTGSYVLDLSDPYENMIAHELLRIATFKRGYRFVTLAYAPAATSGSSSSKLASTAIELARRPKNQSTTADSRTSVLTNRSPVALLFAQIDKDASGSVELNELTQALRDYGLELNEQRLATLVREYDYDQSGSLQADEFHDLFLRCGFAMVDADHSGSLNANELERVLRFVGIADVTPYRIQRMLAQYDLNGSGEIDEHEFLEFMKHELASAAAVGGDASDSEKTLDDAYEAIALREASGVIWKIPVAGVLTVVFDQDPDDLVASSSHSCAEATDDHGSNDSRHRHRRRSSAFAPSQNISDAVVAKLVASVQGMSRNSTEQNDFLQAVLADSDLFFTAQQAEQLLEKQGELRSSARKLAALVRILPQMATRRDAIALVTRVCDAKRAWRERLALRKRLGTLHAVLLGSLTNKFVFDLATQDDRAALKSLALLAQDEKQFSKNRSGRIDTSQHGNWENFRHATLDGKVVLLTTTYILNVLLAPRPSTSSNSSSNSATQRVEFYYVSTTRPPRGTQPLTKRRFDQLVEALAAESVGSEDIEPNESNESSSRSTEALEKTQQNARLRWALVRNAVKQRASRSQTLDTESSARLPSLFRVKSTLDGVQHKLVQLEMLVSDRWLDAEQAAALVAAFPDAIHARARAACILFSRLVDIDNFIKIYDTLSSDDQHECVRRLGWLNIFDPMQPDRQYPPLDLSIRDERELVQLLAQLALHEGQATWREPAYYITNHEVTGELAAPTTLLPSSELPLPAWGKVDATGEQSLKHHGLVRVRFETPVGQRSSSNSSALDHDFRSQLRTHVLCGTRQFL